MQSNRLTLNLQTGGSLLSTVKIIRKRSAKLTFFEQVQLNAFPNSVIKTQQQSLIGS
jgi:hypothetical protein